MIFKNLSRTIDRLIEVEPSLEKKLVPLKKKFNRWPSKKQDYWNELLNIMNNDKNILTHPKREKMKNIIVSKKVHKKKNYTFNLLTDLDNVVGMIPENYADIIKRLDLKSIKIAKDKVEADLTNNFDLHVSLKKQETNLEIETQKVWMKIKDHFDIWASPGQYNIKIKNGALYLVESALNTINGNIIKMDPKILKEFFKFINIDPPPGLQDE